LERPAERLIEVEMIDLSQYNVKVVKKSGKPFKSKLKINTVKAIVTNPQSNKYAYSFKEDDSVVNIELLEIVLDPEDYE
jgi:2-polyprenyl-3-methyl-5-hydroxy-6-metoxy-1,4-benzoquinol methylase